MALIETGIRELDPRQRMDVAKLEDFVRAHIAEFEGPLRLRQFVGGQSNPTYLLDSARTDPKADTGAGWVLRRKPPGPLVSSAHAVDREFRVLSALHPIGIPVPRPRAHCEDESVIGSAFYLMDKVDGRILVDQTLPGWSPEQRRSLYASQLEILASLHALDPVAIGLGDYGRSGNYFARQIHVWSKQYRMADVPRSASMDRLIEWLPENIPPVEETRLVHGDYGLNNFVIHPAEPRIVAVLDWELSTLGHPLADLTYHLSGRLSSQGPFAAKTDGELVRLGIPTQAEYVERYCSLTGRKSVPHLEFYLAFHLFRMAGIMFGIAGRAKAGTAAGKEARDLGRLASPLADRALDRARALGA